MNDKQNKILDAYKVIYNRVYEIAQAKNQDDFLSRVDYLQAAITSIRKLQERGVEQWEFHLGLTDNEFDVLMSEMNNWIDGE